MDNIKVHKLLKVKRNNKKRMRTVTKMSFNHYNSNNPQRLL